jgi:hypothetical protein
VENVLQPAQASGEERLTRSRAREKVLPLGRDRQRTSRVSLSYAQNWFHPERPCPYSDGLRPPDGYNHSLKHAYKVQYTIPYIISTATISFYCFYHFASNSIEPTATRAFTLVDLLYLTECMQINFSSVPVCFAGPALVRCTFSIGLQYTNYSTV